MRGLNRRHLLAAAAASVPLIAQAQFRVEIAGVGTAQLPISIPNFRDEGLAGQAIAAIVRADLERSGQFRVVEANVPLSETSQPAFGEWRQRNVDALAGGSVTRLADGRVDVRFKLWDVVKGSDLGGESQAIVVEDARLAAHRIADAIYEKLTGEKGVFATRMAYVSKVGNKFTLWIADADGEGARDALNSSESIMSPAWSPDGREVIYVSFEGRKASIWAQSLQTGARRQVANFRGTNSAPTYSPDGQQIAMTLSREGGSQLFIMNRDGSNVRRLTTSSAIDTEPVFSPDGKSLYFVSDRGGAPQIYRMSTGGGGVERVTFTGSYNISPALSPDGRTMAFVTRVNGNFKLAVMDMASGAVNQITDTLDDESPSFSPNGRLIVYATRANGREVLMTTTLDGKIKAKLAAGQRDMREPIWGPFGR
ncbi:Tol-Pal system beta propeller repeat protein TolB [Pelomonas sp. SE-A7]|uniref:Tol-Pal system beta propeller repeat protein TolB n=1 Tax=Pelomonas sp. SE-A7 TaxID=3054953 RepID=UPI00259CEF2D|nr:Tol-Pal system beta propeller repeat protein TolB [Pelomonas sp. SE-A7]MDM4765884.1 Tol-Pal system beta propeller repeat protein TolB [Pelomonas sp. SE-A7]